MVVTSRVAARMRSKNLRFAPHVELRRRLVEQDDTCAATHRSQCPGQGHALPLPAGEVRAAVITAGQDGVELREPRRARFVERPCHRLVGRAAGGHVVPQGQFEAHEILEHGGHALPP